MSDGLLVRVVCTDRATHGRRVLRSAIYRAGEFTWKETLVDVTAAPDWKRDEGHAARYRFSCPTCRRERTLMGTTLSAAVDAVAGETQRQKRLDLDISLLP